jgi:hypothetical protein
MPTYGVWVAAGNVVVVVDEVVVVGLGTARLVIMGAGAAGEAVGGASFLAPIVAELTLRLAPPARSYPTSRKSAPLALAIPAPRVARPPATAARCGTLLVLEAARAGPVAARQNKAGPIAATFSERRRLVREKLRDRQVSMLASSVRGVASLRGTTRD